MRGFRLGLLFAGTALAVVLAARTLPAHAANADDQAVESLVPMPDTSLPPPPTARDVTPPAAPAATATPVRRGLSWPPSDRRPRTTFD